MQRLKSSYKLHNWELLNRGNYSFIHWGKQIFRSRLRPLTPLLRQTVRVLPTHSFIPTTVCLQSYAKQASREKRASTYDVTEEERRWLKKCNNMVRIGSIIC